MWLLGSLSLFDFLLLLFDFKLSKDVINLIIERIIFYSLQVIIALKMVIVVLFHSDIANIAALRVSRDEWFCLAWVWFSFELLEVFLIPDNMKVLMVHDSMILLWCKNHRLAHWNIRPILRKLRYLNFLLKNSLMVGKLSFFTFEDMELLELLLIPDFIMLVSVSEGNCVVDVWHTNRKHSLHVEVRRKY
jgi:hypothetical protein